MGIEIRTVAPDEYEAAIDVISTAFLERPNVRVVAASVAQTWDPARTWVAFDGDRACGTFRSWGTQLTVPGGATLPAVCGVGPSPSCRPPAAWDPDAAWRRRSTLLLVERGECVGLLYAAEYPIYGRFGYGPGHQGGRLGDQCAGDARARRRLGVDGPAHG